VTVGHDLDLDVPGERSRRSRNKVSSPKECLATAGLISGCPGDPRPAPPRACPCRRLRGGLYQEREANILHRGNKMRVAQDRLCDDARNHGLPVHDHMVFERILTYSRRFRFSPGSF
jgi:hypothetical protein